MSYDFLVDLGSKELVRGRHEVHEVLGIPLHHSSQFRDPRNCVSAAISKGIFCCKKGSSEPFRGHLEAPRGARIGRPRRVGPRVQVGLVIQERRHDLLHLAVHQVAAASQLLDPSRQDFQRCRAIFHAIFMRFHAFSCVFSCDSERFEARRASHQRDEVQGRAAVLVLRVRLRLVPQEPEHLRTT